MSSPCMHPKTGRVTTHPNGGHDAGRQASTNVCDLPECISEAKKWVSRMAGRKAFHVLDSEAGA